LADASLADASLVESLDLALGGPTGGLTGNCSHRLVLVLIQQVDVLLALEFGNFGFGRRLAYERDEAEDTDNIRRITRRSNAMPRSRGKLNPNPVWMRDL
jgi:hypothetical protein